MEFPVLEKRVRAASHSSFLCIGAIEAMFAGLDRGDGLLQYLDTAAQGLRLARWPQGADPHASCMARALTMARDANRPLQQRPFPQPSSRAERKELNRDHALLVGDIPEMQSDLCAGQHVSVGVHWSSGSLTEEYPWRLVIRFHPVDRPEEAIQVDAWFTRGPWATLLVAYFSSMDAMVRECIASLRDSTDPAHQRAVAILQPLLAF